MLRILSRKSPLAIVQVREILRSLGDPPAETVLLDTFGDVNKGLSLLEGQRPDFFTDSIDRALLDGAGDCAVHSAKDLPWPLTAGLELAALTARADGSDSLVSVGNLTLSELPRGSRVATSSALRRESILARRPDLQIVSLRGTIGERLAYLDKGEADAVIVATCALTRLGLESRISEKLDFDTHPLQGMLAVVVRKGDPSAYARFAPIDSRLHYGKVWIVGSGPGDPSLLTAKGAHALSRAQVLVYDDLASREIVQSSRAEMIYVGKRKGRHSVSQDEINDALYRKALEGKRVVRLKGGDPFVFGRLGEELEYLGSRHIPVEVIPGVSSFQAAAAEALMPLTQRGKSDRVSLITAHRAEGAEGNAETRAVFMGASAKDELPGILRSSGDEGSRRVCLARNASRPDAKVEIAEIGDLASASLESPLMILSGNTVPAVLPRRVLHVGLDPVEPAIDGVICHYPLIATQPIFGAKMPEGGFDAVILTSRVGAKLFLERFGIPDVPIVAIGDGTEEEIVLHGGTVAAKPPHADSDSLDAMIRAQGAWETFLYPCSAASRNALHENPSVRPFALYRTVSREREPIDLSSYSAIVISSPSACDAFCETFGSFPPHAVIYVHGRKTKARLISRGAAEDRIIQIPGKNKGARDE